MGHERKHGHGQARRRISFDALGTDNVITAYAADDAAADDVEQALEEARDRVLLIHEEMSAFSEESDVGRINAASGRGVVGVSDDTMRVLLCARHVAELSGGAFDPTVRPLSALWRFKPGEERIPSQAETDAAMGLVGWRDLICDEVAHTAGLARPGQAIDLGGIAKGFAADACCEVLAAHGISHAIIDLGGNISTMGAHLDGTPWQIGIQNPLSGRGELATTISVEGATIVTSGINEQFFVRDGVLYHHIIDPRTGRPATGGIASATVVAESSLLADALATAVLVLGAERGAELVRQEGARLLVITTEGDMYASFDTSVALSLKTW